MNDESRLGLALEMRNIRKTFPGTVAVDGVDFDVCAGEVHALLGENGAGKSTLMRILAGSYSDYTGEISINGMPVRLHSPGIAQQHGIGMIYQELSLARPISIAENILVGRLPVKAGFVVDRKRMNALARSALQRVGLDLDPFLPVDEISPHEAQLVEIAKALQHRPCILVMDEPTSALSREEADRLFAIIGNLRREGLAIVYISHHLPEIFRIADRITVLRDGRRVDTRRRDEATPEAVIQLMVGRSVKEFYRKHAHSVGKERLKVENLSRFGFFHHVTFSAREGEILGIGGLSGAGRTELARVLVGLDSADGGAVYLEGERLDLRNMASAVEKGMAYLSEDRKTEGLATRLTVEDNVLIALIPRLTARMIYNRSNGAPVLNRLIKELAIYPPQPQRPVANLSGGNQQKVLLAKWMACEPKVLILDEPTRGVDIGAKMIIHESVERLAEAGHTVILISSDLPELVGLSDRIMIMRRGRFIREMSGAECTEESLLLAANGEGGG